MMKKLIVFLMISSFCLLTAGARKVTLADVTSGTYRAAGLGGIKPMADGEHYTRMSVDRKRVVKYSFRTGEEVGTVFDVTTARDCPFRSFDGYSFSPDERLMLIQTDTRPIYRRSATATYYLYNIKNNKVEPLSDGGPQQVPLFSPDGNQVAFVRDGNLFLVKLLFGNSESQVTTDGRVGEVLNGVPDWVYEEEFEFSRAFDFSADSQMLAYIRFDESRVPEYSFPIYRGLAPARDEFATYPGIYRYKYPMAGEENSRVTVHTFDIKSKVTRQLDLPLDADGYVPRIRFTHDPDVLAVMTLNRHQNRLDLYLCNPRSTLCRLAVRDEASQYVKESAYGDIVFYPRHFVMMSERDGYNHLYLYTSAGNLVKQVTKGSFEVKSFLGWDEASNTFYYESNEGSPLRTAVYKVDGKGRKTCLSKREGTNHATFSRSLKYFVNTYSSVSTPPVVTLNDNSGKTLATLLDNADFQVRLGELDMPTKELFTFTTSGGTVLNGWMMKPADFDPSRKYPVVMHQYSGPGSQEVLDQWGIGARRDGGVFEAYLAGQGFICVSVDGRGTGGRGSEFEKCTYLNLGIKEAEDQVEAAKYLGTLPYVDASRIGIWGWSFGGYNVLMSMSEGTPVFKAGVAVAAPTDWRFYDTVYTERFMRTPKENAEGYAATSAMGRAGKLHGDLLLVQGTADDNVHLRNNAEYSEALVQADKQFDMQVYTNRNHGISGGNTSRHLLTRVTNFLIGHLCDK